MSQKPNRSRTERLVTIATVIVALLLVINISLLVVVKLKTSNKAPVSPDNIIGVTGEAEFAKVLRVGSPLSLFSASQTKENLTLSWWTGYDGEKTFKAQNLMPGDVVVKEYTVTPRYKTAVKITFDVANVVEAPSEYLLSDILTIKIDVNGTEAYNGSFLKAQQIVTPLEAATATQPLTYKITVSMPTSVGNEYARKTLTADFKWVLEEKDPPLPPDTESTPSVTTKPVEPPVTEPIDPPVTEPIETDPPQTEPPQTEPIDPPETDPIVPPVTEPIDPPQTEPIDPPDTDPIKPDPPETTPIGPPIIIVGEHDNCCRCFFCHWLVGLFGIHNQDCFSCRIVTAISGSDEKVCVCPWGCLILALLILAIIVIVTRYLWVKSKAKQYTDAATDTSTDTNGGTE